MGLRLTLTSYLPRRQRDWLSGMLLMKVWDLGLGHSYRGAFVMHLLSPPTPTMSEPVECLQKAYDPKDRAKC